MKRVREVWRLTDRKSQEKRDMAFWCDDKWSVGYWCRRKELSLTHEEEAEYGETMYEELGGTPGRTTSCGGLGYVVTKSNHEIPTPHWIDHIERRSVLGSLTYFSKAMICTIVKEGGRSSSQVGSNGKITTSGQPREGATGAYTLEKCGWAVLRCFQTTNRASPT